MNAAAAVFRKLGKKALSFALAFGIWFAPVPAGLTREAWHLFAVFAAAIFAVVVNAFPLLTASLLSVGAVVLTGTVDPAKAFAGFANSSVLLVVVAFLVAHGRNRSRLGSILGSPDPAFPEIFSGRSRTGHDAKRTHQGFGHP